MRRIVYSISLILMSLFFNGFDGNDTDGIIPGGPVSIIRYKNNYRISNGYYDALIDDYGELLSVYDRTKNEYTFQNDNISLATEYHPQPFTKSEFGYPRTEILDLHDYYIRLRWTACLRYQGGSIENQSIARTYEFTRSPHIFEQVAILGDEWANDCSMMHPATANVTSLVWSVQKHPTNGAVNRLHCDVLAALPKYNEFGGRTLNNYPNWFSHFSHFSHDPNPTRVVVQDGKFAGTETPAAVGPCSNILSSTVFSVVPEVLGPSNDLLISVAATFRTNYGIYSGESETSRTDWKVYQSPANNLIPLRRKYVENPTADDWLKEDFLIRMGVHMAHRFEQDGGWPRWRNANGLHRNTADSRSFPFIAYLWSYLTCENVGKHTTNHEADWIFNALDGARKFYGNGNCPGDTENFEDLFENWAHYISYASGKKECQGSGYRDIRILNTHAHALHFAWTMWRAAEMKGNKESMKAWAEIIRRFHQGSKALYRNAIPGSWDGISYSGTVDYGVGYDRNHDGEVKDEDHEGWNINSMSYNGITQDSIPAGYQFTNEYEPEFINAVERACKLDSNVTDNISESEPYSSFVPRMIRTIPLALVYAGDDISMNEGFGHSALIAGDLRELTSFAWKKYQLNGISDGWLWHYRTPGEAIIENLNKVIWTNKPFMSDWVFPFWFEMKPENIPYEKRFWVTFKSELTPSEERNLPNPRYWVVYRTGNTIEIMSNLDGGKFILHFPPQKKMGFKESYRDYNEPIHLGHFTWYPMIWGPYHPGREGSITSTPGQPISITIETPIKPKRIITVTLSPEYFENTQYSPWVFPSNLPAEEKRLFILPPVF